MPDWDVAVVGAGPGGYVAAIRAAQLGKRVVLFEGERVGGLCLNWGCIPSKAILKAADIANTVRGAGDWGITVTDPSFDFGAAIDRSRTIVDRVVGGVEGLLRDNGVTTIAANATFADSHTLQAGGETHRAAAIIIATGATTRMLPGVPVDGDVIVTSREALAGREAPREAVIIGGGAIGVEFAYAWASYGTTVTIVEMLPTLVPNEDEDCGRLLERSFRARGITVLTGTRVASVTRDGARATVRVEKDGQQQDLSADRVLVAIGFVPRTEGLGLDAAGVATERGYVAIDENMRTNVAHIYAIGDVTGKLMLAHVASQQGVLAAEAIAGMRVTPLDYRQMPRATFCQPHVGSVGFTEKQAREAGYDVKTGRFPFTALGQAIAVGETEGFVKVVADVKTGQVLGIHMIGHDVNALLGEASLAALLEATTVELGFAVHAHPTMPEALKEAALAVNGEAIHFARRRPSGGAPSNPERSSP